MGISKNSDHIQLKIKMPTPVRNLQCPPKPQSRLKGHTCSWHLQKQDREHRCVKDQYQYSNQYRYAKLQWETSSILQRLGQDSQDINVFCTFLVKMESQNSEHGYTKDQYSDHMKILIKIPNPIHKLFQPKANHCKAELVSSFI